MRLIDVLSDPDAYSALAWLYLPRGANWGPETDVEVLVSEEVPPELEDVVDAGIPEAAKLKGLVRALPMAAVQDIVANASTQKPGVSTQELFDALAYYYQHDAFLPL